MKTERIKEYSYLRTLACIAIIFIHVISQGISAFAGRISAFAAHGFAGAVQNAGGFACVC